MPKYTSTYTHVRIKTLSIINDKIVIWSVTSFMCVCMKVQFIKEYGSTTPSFVLVFRDVYRLVFYPVLNRFILLVQFFIQFGVLRRKGVIYIIYIVPFSSFYSSLSVPTNLKSICTYSPKNGRYPFSDPFCVVSYFNYN